MYMDVYSNKNFTNVPLTKGQIEVVDFLAFESEVSIIYSFAVKFDDVTMDMVNSIVESCDGNTDDIKTLYKVCENVLGINPYWN